MSQRCRAQWIKVILICLQKQFQLKDFGVGDAKWGILRHHKTQGHDEIIKTAVSMEKGCEYIRTKRNWQKSQTHNWELQNPFLWKERKHVRGWTVLSAESVEAACNGSINSGGGQWATSPGSTLPFGFITDWKQLRSELCADRTPLHISGEAAGELALYMLKCCHNS